MYILIRTLSWQKSGSGALSWQKPGFGALYWQKPWSWDYNPDHIWMEGGTEEPPVISPPPLNEPLYTAYQNHILILYGRQVVTHPWVYFLLQDYLRGAKRIQRWMIRWWKGKMDEIGQSFLVHSKREITPWKSTQIKFFVANLNLLCVNDYIKRT